MRRTFVVNAGRSAGENDSVYFRLRNFRGRNVESSNLGINLQLAHTAGDDLRVLRAEIEDENFRMGGRRHHFKGAADIQAAFPNRMDGLVDCSLNRWAPN